MMRSQAARMDRSDPEAAVAGPVDLPGPVKAMPLDPLIAVLSQAAHRSAPVQPRDRQPTAQG